MAHYDSAPGPITSRCLGSRTRGHYDSKQDSEDDIAALLVLSRPDLYPEPQAFLLQLPPWLPASQLYEPGQGAALSNGVPQAGQGTGAAQSVSPGDQRLTSTLHQGLTDSEEELSQAGDGGDEGQQEQQEQQPAPTKQDQPLQCERTARGSDSGPHTSQPGSPSQWSKVCSMATCPLDTCSAPSSRPWVMGSLASRIAGPEALGIVPGAAVGSAAGLQSKSRRRCTGALGPGNNSAAVAALGASSEWATEEDRRAGLTGPAALHPSNSVSPAPRPAAPSLHGGSTSSSPYPMLLLQVPAAGSLSASSSTTWQVQGCGAGWERPVNTSDSRTTAEGGEGRRVGGGSECGAGASASPPGPGDCVAGLMLRERLRVDATTAAAAAAAAAAMKAKMRGTGASGQLRLGLVMASRPRRGPAFEWGPPPLDTSPVVGRLGPQALTMRSASELPLRLAGGLGPSCVVGSSTCRRGSDASGACSEAGASAGAGPRRSRLDRAGVSWGEGHLGWQSATSQRAYEGIITDRGQPQPSGEALWGQAAADQEQEYLSPECCLPALGPGLGWQGQVETRQGGSERGPGMFVPVPPVVIQPDFSQTVLRLSAPNMRAFTFKPSVNTSPLRGATIARPPVIPDTTSLPPPQTEASFYRSPRRGPAGGRLGVEGGKVSGGAAHRGSSEANRESVPAASSQLPKAGSQELSAVEVTAAAAEAGRGQGQAGCRPDSMPANGADGMPRALPLASLLLDGSGGGQSPASRSLSSALQGCRDGFLTFSPRRTSNGCSGASSAPGAVPLTASPDHPGVPAGRSSSGQVELGAGEPEGLSVQSMPLLLYGTPPQSLHRQADAGNTSAVSSPARPQVTVSKNLSPIASPSRAALHGGQSRAGLQASGAQAATSRSLATNPSRHVTPSDTPPKPLTACDNPAPAELSLTFESPKRLHLQTSPTPQTPTARTDLDSCASPPLPRSTECLPRLPTSKTPSSLPPAPSSPIAPCLPSAAQVPGSFTGYAGQVLPSFLPSHGSRHNARAGPLPHADPGLPQPQLPLSSPLWLCKDPQAAAFIDDASCSSSPGPDDVQSVVVGAHRDMGTSPPHSFPPHPPSPQLLQGQGQGQGQGGQGQATSCRPPRRTVAPLLSPPQPVQPAQPDHRNYSVNSQAPACPDHPGLQGMAIVPQGTPTDARSHAQTSSTSAINPPPVSRQPSALKRPPHRSVSGPCIEARRQDGELRPSNSMQATHGQRAPQGGST